MPVKIEPDAAGMSESRLERITEHFATNYVDTGKMVGCQATVVRGGHVAYHRSLGLMDREQGTPMADDAIFRIYSMTKPIASVALMQLYERGMFQLLDPVHVTGHGTGPGRHRHDRVADQLPRSVVGDVAAPIAVLQFGADRHRVDQDVLRAGPHPHGVHGSVLEEQQPVVPTA